MELNIDSLNLFDGIGTGYVSLLDAGFKVDNYYSSEINKHSKYISEKNNPNISHIGDVINVNGYEYRGIDLLMGGFPCQPFSFGGKEKGFLDDRGQLFFEVERILNEAQPKYFLFENVNMKKEFSDEISKRLGVNPIIINSNLVSAQNRVRSYWTNIPNVNQPNDRNINIQSIIGENQFIGRMVGRRIDHITNKRKDNSDIPIQQYIECRSDNKTNCISTVRKDNVVVSERFNNRILACDLNYRYLTIEECEQIQGLPIGYTEGVPITHRFNQIGNGWTMKIISHILSNMKG